MPLIKQNDLITLLYMEKSHWIFQTAFNIEQSWIEDHDMRIH